MFLNTLLHLTLLLVILLVTSSPLLSTLLVILTSGVEEKFRDKETEKKLELSLSVSYKFATGTTQIDTSVTFLNPTRLYTHSELISFRGNFETNGMMTKYLSGMNL